MFSTVCVDQYTDNGIDCSAKHDRSDNDEEVLYDEVGYRIWVLLAREDPEDVTHDLHDKSNDHGAEVPCSMSREEEDMCEKGQEEQYGAEHADRKGWGVPVI